jgi:hypothetical protein
MEARYTFRKTQLLDECQVAPEIFEQVVPRLYTFMGACSHFPGQDSSRARCEVAICFNRFHRPAL